MTSTPICTPATGIFASERYIVCRQKYRGYRKTSNDDGQQRYRWMRSYRMDTALASWGFSDVVLLCQGQRTGTPVF
jgi:hypothetical protein